MQHRTWSVLLSLRQTLPARAVLQCTRRRTLTSTLFRANGEPSRRPPDKAKPAQTRNQTEINFDRDFVSDSWDTSPGSDEHWDVASFSDFPGQPDARAKHTVAQSSDTEGNAAEGFPAPATKQGDAHGNPKAATRNPIKLMVAIDGSPHAKEAFMVARNTIVPDKDRLILTHIVTFPDVSILTHEGDTLEHGDIAADSNKYGEQLTDERVAKLKTDYEPLVRGLNAQWLVQADVAVGDALITLSEREKVSMLVVGSRGLGTLQRLLLGSVAQYCVTNCKCPVLVVHPSKSE